METNEIIKLKRRNRFLVVTSLSMTIICFLFFIYAFVQSEIAKEKEKLAIAMSIQLKECQKQAQASEQRAIVAEREAIKQIAMAQQATKAEKSGAKISR